MQAGAFYEQELRIAASDSELQRVRNWTAAVAAHCGYDRRRRFGVVTAVHEAVANQLAGAAAPRRAICIRAVWSAGSLTFHIGSPMQLEPGLGTQIMRHMARDVEVRPGSVRLSV